jgi:hypothetical protein
MTVRNTRRTIFLLSLLATATSFFALGSLRTWRADAAARQSYEARLDALRAELQRAVARESEADDVPKGTSGLSSASEADDEATIAERARMIAEIKEQLRTEMGLLPVSLLRERRASFVELHTYDNSGGRDYGTAGYLGGGYFITVKHAVVALHETDGSPSRRTVAAIKVVYEGKEIPAKLVDAGKAEMEVDPGDWAIIKTRDLDLPPLRVDPAFSYEFAEPIFRLGNDYSKGIVVSTGYVGQKTAGGLVTCLTDGHPGVSGGGVLDQRGTLVGIPIGRMQGDYRFSFILPIRPEMMRKVPAFQAENNRAAAAFP